MPRRKASASRESDDLDLGSDKQSPLLEYAETEANPALGVRGLRLALAHREWFLAQLRGLLRAAVHGPLRIMLPMVTSLPELKVALELVDEARAQLAEARVAHSQDVPVGMMVEVPSAVVMMERFVDEVIQKLGHAYRRRRDLCHG